MSSYSQKLAAVRDYQGDCEHLYESLSEESFVRLDGVLGKDFGGLPNCIFVGDFVQSGYCIDRKLFVK